MIAKRMWGMDVEVGGGRTGQARRQHAVVAVGDEREAAVAV